MKTLDELLNYMIANCYNLNYYTVNASPKYDGFCIEKWGELFVWSYSERGNRTNLNYFSDEKSAVDFVMNKIMSDKLANSHLISILSPEDSESNLINELSTRNINYWTDKIPTLKGLSTRFFVIGCDVNKVVDLIQKVDSLR